MKKMTTSLLLLFAGFSLNAQEACDGGRYSSDVFTNVTVTSNITYGSNLNFNGTTKSLKLDFYEPQGDVETARPLIVWVHGGSFLGGTKTDQDMVALSNAFTKKGYVCASIDYRTGFFPIDSANSIKAVLRAVHDLRAAVRFFYKDADGANTYKVDTTNIFIGGSSAGAITALHYEYLNKTCEVSETNYISQTTLDQVGGMEGISGNPCYSSDVKGVINLCGALARYNWLEAGDLPLCSMHGTNDATVGYNRQIVNPGVPLMYLDGSRMLREQAEAVGVANPFYTFYNAPHVPYLGTSASALAYMDTTVNFVRDFLIDQMGCTDAALQAENAYVQTSTLYTVSACTVNVPFEDCTSLTINEFSELEGLTVYPNPAKSYFTIEVLNDDFQSIQITDMNGRSVNSVLLTGSTTNVDCSAMKPGIYFVIATNNKNQSRTIKLIIE
jgi:para-nitrobenzyl esterase